MFLTIEEIDHLLIFIHDYSEGCKVCRKTKEKLEEAKKILNWNTKKWADNQIPTALPKSAEQLIDEYNKRHKKDCSNPELRKKYPCNCIDFCKINDRPARIEDCMLKEKIL